MRKPIVYIASPYSKGDPAINTHFQCQIFDQLLGDDIVIPFAPLWAHFQHLLFPRPYYDWLEYDMSLLHLFNACLRLDAESARPDIMQYHAYDSFGADKEMKYFVENGKPVFFAIDKLYEWALHTFNK